MSHGRRRRAGRPAGRRPLKQSLFAGLALLSAACAHAPRNETGESRASPAASASGSPAKLNPIVAPTTGWAPLEIKEPVALRLKGDPARVESVQYCAFSNAKTFAGSELRSDKDEATSFTVETRTTRADAGRDRISQLLRTTRKEGPMDLRDFAMPESGERLELVLSSQAKVLRAGNFPKGSLYYVPTTSLPEAPVGKGDTWTMQATWSPIGEDARLQLDMLSILKGFWSCGTNRCAEIEISGGVQAGSGGVAIPGYRNEWRGRLLFDVDAGTVVWSRLESDESFEGDRGKRVVKSSLEGTMIAPEALKPPGAALAACASPPEAGVSPSAPRK